MTRRIVGLFVAVICTLLLWVRLAPISVDEVHRIGPLPHAAAGDWGEPEEFEAVRQVPAPKAALTDLVKIATARPETEVLEGSADEGLVTVVTRSSVLGVPEITNLWIEGDRVHLRGRAAFPLLTLGSQRARAESRIDAWLGLAGLR